MDEALPRTGPQTEPPQELSGLRRTQQLIAEHGQLAAKAGAFLGLGLTTLYFIRAGSIPLDSLSNLGALAVVVALLALLSALAFLVLWVMPPAVALLFQSEDPQGHLAHWFRRSADGQALSKARQWRRAFLFSFVTAAVVWVWLAACSLPGMFSSAWLRWGACALSAAAASVLCWKFVTYPLPATDEPPMAGRRLSALAHRLLFIVFYAVTSLGPLLLLLTLLTTSELRHDGRAPVMWAMLAGGFVIATVANAVGLAAFQQLKRPWAFAVLAAVGIYTLMIIVVPLGSSPRLLDGLMQLSTIRMAHVSLVLDDKTCATVRLLGVVPSPVPSASSPAEARCLLENVTVVSRVGERWVIACERDDPATDQAGSHQRRNFRIEAKGVLGEMDAGGEVKERTGKVGVCG